MLRTSSTRPSWTITAPAPMPTARLTRGRSAGTSGGSLSDIAALYRTCGSSPRGEQRDHLRLHEMMHAEDLAVAHLDRLDRAHRAVAVELEAGAAVDADRHRADRRVVPAGEHAAV